MKWLACLLSVVILQFTSPAYSNENNQKDLNQLLDRVKQVQAESITS